MITWKNLWSIISDAQILNRKILDYHELLYQEKIFDFNIEELITEKREK